MQDFLQPEFETDSSFHRPSPPVPPFSEDVALRNNGHRRGAWCHLVGMSHHAWYARPILPPTLELRPRVRDPLLRRWRCSSEYAPIERAATRREAHARTRPAATGVGEVGSSSPSSEAGDGAGSELSPVTLPSCSPLQIGVFWDADNVACGRGDEIVAGAVAIILGHARTAATTTARNADGSGSATTLSEPTPALVAPLSISLAPCTAFGNATTFSHMPSTSFFRRVVSPYGHDAADLLIKSAISAFLATVVGPSAGQPAGLQFTSLEAESADSGPPPPGPPPPPPPPPRMWVVLASADAGFAPTLRYARACGAATLVVGAFLPQPQRKKKGAVFGGLARRVAASPGAWLGRHPSAAAADVAAVWDPREARIVGWWAAAAGGAALTPLEPLSPALEAALEAAESAARQAGGGDS